MQSIGIKTVVLLYMGQVLDSLQMFFLMYATAIFPMNAQNWFGLFKKLCNQTIIFTMPGKHLTNVIFLSSIVSELLMILLKFSTKIIITKTRNNISLLNKNQTYCLLINENKTCRMHKVDVLLLKSPLHVSVALSLSLIKNERRVKD